MGFQQGLSGLNTSAKALDVIGNNIANSNTVGFKTGQTQFADVFAASLSGAGSAPVGLGAKVGAVVQQFTQGNVTSTNNPLDVAINGGGFYQMDDGLGGTLYARNGQFQLDQDGFVVNAQGLQLKGIMADAATGVITTGAPPEPLRLFDPATSLSGPPMATGNDITNGWTGTGLKVNVNLDSRESVPTTSPFDYTNVSTYNKATATTIYDTLGNPHTYSMYFVKLAAVAPVAANSWGVYSTVTNPDGSTTDLSVGGTVSRGTLVFDSNGTLLPSVAPATTVLSDEDFGGAADVALGYPGAIDATQSFPVDFTGSTQFGANFAVNAVIQDGYGSGTLAGFNIGADGVVMGRYTNGRSTPVGQVILAAFRNPNGLQPLGNNVWGVTSSSGNAITGVPGSSGQFGPLQSAAVEDANVDLTAELVMMITQQRVYQANAQTIKTQDQVLQTLVNLR